MTDQRLREAAISVLLDLRRFADMQGPGPDRRLAELVDALHGEGPPKRIFGLGPREREEVCRHGRAFRSVREGRPSVCFHCGTEVG